MRLAALSLTLLACLACDDAPPDPPPLDMGTPDQSAPPPPCVENPTTHLEIINACTTATGVSKVAITPLLGADGTLPPLP